jgi:organic hydroperoxide reductase OsmC/OhrA
MANHHYKATITWTGNLGSGTSNYRSYDRSHSISVNGKPAIAGSSDPAFRGDPAKYNPEELLIASLSACHMLWYLHLCAEAGVVVIDYVDTATGVIVETSDGGGHFSQVILYPKVVVSDQSIVDKANELHHKANKLCFIANSCNFPILHRPTCHVQNEG